MPEGRWPGWAGGTSYGCLVLIFVQLIFFVIQFLIVFLVQFLVFL
jgi:hypothetical protein